MKGIGIRELRQHASRYLRAVEQGESIEVTDRGRPVAWLVPVPREGGLEILAASGRLSEAARDPDEIPEPLEPTEGVPPASEELAKLRAGER